MNKMKHKWWEYDVVFSMKGGGTMSTFKYKKITRNLENKIQRFLVDSISINGTPFVQVMEMW